MRPVLVTLLLALLLVAAACEGADPGNGDAAQPGVTEPTPDGDGPLGTGVAATVNGTEIPASEIDARLAAAEDDPQFSDALAGEEGEMLAAQFRAQTLSVLIQTQIVLDGAEDMDATPTDEDVERTRDEVHEQFGGEEQFEEAFATSGMSREALDDQVRSVAVLDAVGRTLAERGEVPEAPEGVDEAGAQELAVQQWLGEQLAQADVVVDPAYGEWSAEAGQVVPQQAGLPGELQESPAGDPTP